MVILGLNAYHADSAACLIVDGKLVAAAEEERFRRIKHWAGLPTKAIDYCLSEARLNLSEVEHIAINRKPGVNNWRRLGFVVTHWPSPRLMSQKIKNIRSAISAKETLEETYKMELKAEVHQVEHHLAHLASAFLVSDFQEAACLSVDGFGDFTSTAFGFGFGQKITINKRIYFPHSLGVFYSALTQFLGFHHYGDEYKVMGLAPYGAPNYIEPLREVVRLRNDGTFRLNLDYFRHHSDNVSYTWKDCTPSVGLLYKSSLIDLLGPPRSPNEPLEQKHKDLARSVQVTYEKAFFALLHTLHKQHPCNNLALAGGCAMNSVANGKIYRRTPFTQMYLPAAAGDAGGAIGAAAVVLAKLGDSAVQAPAARRLPAEMRPSRETVSKVRDAVTDEVPVVVLEEEGDPFAAWGSGGTQEKLTAAVTDAPQRADFQMLKEEQAGGDATGPEEGSKRSTPKGFASRQLNAQLLTLNDEVPPSPGSGVAVGSPTTEEGKEEENGGMDEENAEKLKTEMLKVEKENGGTAEDGSKRLTLNEEGGDDAADTAATTEEGSERPTLNPPEDGSAVADAQLPTPNEENGGTEEENAEKLKTGMLKVEQENGGADEQNAAVTDAQQRPGFQMLKTETLKIQQENRGTDESRPEHVERVVSGEEQDGGDAVTIEEGGELPTPNEEIPPLPGPGVAGSGHASETDGNAVASASEESAIRTSPSEIPPSHLSSAISYLPSVPDQNEIPIPSVPLRPLHTAYLGPESTQAEIHALLDWKKQEIGYAGCVATFLSSEEELTGRAAQAIADGKVVGWFQGRMEWGPRALGNRSIVADPRRADMKDILNAKIKRRESFRPFAPSILREAVNDWFEQDDDVPFMMEVFQIRAQKRSFIPAVTHVDGSGRLQTVHKETNGRFYRLIEKFRDLTGIPMVLNTSFNENEPVVCYPEEALDCFLRTKMDLLVLGNFCIERKA